MAKVFDTRVEAQLLTTLLDGSSKLRLRALGMAGPELFGYPPCREIRERIDKLLQKPQSGLVRDLGELIPTSSQMARSPGLTTEARNFIATKRKPLKSLRAVRAAVETAREYARRRHVQAAFETIGDEMEKDRKIDYDAIKESAFQLVGNLTGSEDERELVQVTPNGSDEFFDGLFSNLSLIPTGIHSHDKRSRGLINSSFLLIAAPSGHGKSTLGMNLVINMAAAGYRVCVINYEMAIPVHGARLVSCTTGIPHEYLLQWEHRKTERRERKVKRRFKQFLDGVYEKGGSFCYQPPAGATIPEMQVLLSSFKFDVVLIDDINNAPAAKGSKREEQLYYNAQSAAAMATNNNQLVIGLTQLGEDGAVKYCKGMDNSADYYWRFECAPEDRQDDDFTPVMITPGKVRSGLPAPFTVGINYSQLKVISMDPTEFQMPHREFRKQRAQQGLPEVVQ